MRAEFAFNAIDRLETELEAEKIREFLHQHRESYPHSYHAWVETKVLPNLRRAGKPEAKYDFMAVLSPDASVLAEAIYQPLGDHEPHWDYLAEGLGHSPDSVDPVEIKNFRVAEENGVAGLDQLLLQQFVHQFRGQPLVADVTASNARMKGWFVKHDFYFCGREELYEAGQQEEILVNPNGSGFTPPQYL